MTIKVLFICVHNAARSQMAEELLRKYGGDLFEVQSAGFEPSTVNPLVVEVMKEEGIDLTAKSTQSVYRLLKENQFFGFVITVCDRSREADCPVFPGVPSRRHWDLENPENFTGTDEEKLDKVRALKDQIKTRVLELIGELKARS
ncbi:MAG: arsenate reductase ArsC [Clostridia bacterium]|nr:arsenate reductase ArsC [Clostridia bacterium]